MKHTIISAQMGALSNLIKNIVLLSDNIYWPTNVDRLELILNQYNVSLKQDKSSWVDLEAKLNSKLGNYFLMELNYWSVKQHLPTQPCVFINHSLFWNMPSDFNKQLDHLNVLFVMPQTDFGIEWQTRAAFEKVVAPNFDQQYDFCFEPDKKEQKIKSYIADHGQENYFKFNVHNMRFIFKQQQQELIQNVDTHLTNFIWLEDIVLGSADLVSTKIEQAIDIKLDRKQVDQILRTWRSLHWRPEDTFDWPYAWSSTVNFPME
jgi:hypothetical protein